MGEAQRAYEAKRAAKAGMSLDKWLSSKEREKQDAEKARLVAAAAPARKPGFFARLMEKATKPI
ncbi:hypothetical protein IAI18_04085 [Acetobacteraceae bacterium H6797]|nr:hypothetical protein [Acetobacteraceae bacterium H6797]